MDRHKKGGAIPPGAPGHPLTDERRGGASGRGLRKALRQEAARGARKADPRTLPREEGPKPLPGRWPARAPRESGPRFLYEDADLVAVDKPSGLPVIAPEGSRAKSLYDLVTERLRRRNPKARAAVVHRLDRDSSGVLVFATNARAKRILMTGWDELALERRYLAVVEGWPEGESGVMEDWLAPEGPDRVRLAKPGERGAKPALTLWRCLAKGRSAPGRGEVRKLALLELELRTGRKHQIRVQLASRGLPVSGDPKYGGGGDALGRLALHASLLVLSHPSDGGTLRFESPAPPGFEAAVRPPAREEAAGPKPSSPNAKDRRGSATRPAGPGRPPRTGPRGGRGSGGPSGGAGGGRA